MESLLVLFFTVLGLLVGSFLNVAVLRFGFTERASARSRCASCDTALEPHDLVPVMSYVALRGRCRTCGSSLSVQYPLVELATAALFGATYAYLVPATTLEAISFLSVLGFWAALLVLVAYDIRHTLIPMQFVYMLWAFAGVHAAVAAYHVMSFAPLIDAVVGSVVCGGFFALIHVATRGKGMGIGDAYVAGALGLLLGLGAGVAASAFGVWIGAAVGVAGLGVTRMSHALPLSWGVRRVTLSTEIPFAPFLAVGAVIAYFVPLTTLLGQSWGILP